MKVAIYLRVSTAEQASEGVSLDAQRAKALAYAQLYELEVVAVIEDAGQSAKSLARPGLKRALKLLRAGDVDALLVAKLDRLSRSVVDMATLIEKYFGERGGKHLLSVGDSIDTRSAAGRLVLNILTSVSEWERAAIAERTRDALHHLRREGVALGQVPLGYRRGAGGKLERDDDEAATVARARELAQTLSLREVAAQLTSEGRRTKRGGAWHAATIRKLIVDR